MSPRQKMTRDEEHEFYARPENQEPQGPARRRRSRLTEMVPVSLRVVQVPLDRA